jgi:Cu/Ag efflux protein CusF
MAASGSSVPPHSPQGDGARVLVLLLVLLGCGQAPPEDAAPETSAAVYEVRGVVRQLPAADQPSKEVQIRHEAIPDFVDMEGRQVGMDAMTMPFPVKDLQLLDGIAVGDRVLFRFRVDWNGSPPLELVAMEKLPPE